MGMIDCPNCWDTPCTCRTGHGYRHLSLNELKGIREGLDKLIVEREKLGGDPNRRQGQTP